MQLLSYPALVESPYIIVTIGKYTFGSYTKTNSVNKFGSTVTVTYPNFMQSIDIVKINGAVNTYSIKMIYAISAGDDPNLLEKVFSTVSNTRKIVISYGDWASPTFIYREESAIITKVQSSVDFSGSKISYTISCTSDSLSLKANTYDFGKRLAKPSDVIKELLFNREYRKYGLLDIFYGMTDRKKILEKNIIASDDKQVTIEAKHSINILDYLNYLVNCMAPASNTSNNIIKDARYYLTIVDDIEGKLGGPYFKITKILTSVSLLNSIDTYEIDIGYPGDNFVTNFTLKNDEQWSILYNYSNKVDQTKYIYKIDNNGDMTTQYSPSIARSAALMKTTETDRTWWTQVTQFPIAASLTIKGLLRPSILMSYVKLNVLFYGQRHISSGVYIITKQEDSIDNTGYKTVLSLLRIRGDE